MPDREKVINKVTAIVADMQEEVDEWKDYSDSELRGGLTCDCDWWYKTLQTLNDALALLKAQEPEAMDAPKPDSDIGCWYDITHNYTLEQVISALKAQEPRVMTESELEGYISSLDGEARVWIEHKKLGLYCASLWSRNPSRGDQNFYDVMHECYFDRSEIGKWWRPWTSCPTDEQREAAAWMT